MTANSPVPTAWHHGVTRYQWLVLAIAAAGWAFDAFEGQLFVLTRPDLLKEIIASANPTLSADDLASEIKRWGDIMQAFFLAGGTLGGWMFSSLADKQGRRPVMVLTILCYSIFSGLTALATSLWEVAALRFLVAMGVAGEWAVGAALVAEVFPLQARTRASGIFHATSVLGLWLAGAAGMAVGSNWRWAYVIGLIPALLTLWVRAGIREPEKWEAARSSKRDQLGSFRELLGNPLWRSRALFGALLATVGMATFWGVTVAGQDLCAGRLKQLGYDATEAASKSKFAYGFVQAAGAGLGMLAMGPLCARLGRRRAFALMHVGALLIVPAVCWIPGDYVTMLLMLPLMGFFTLGIHAGYAVYFPELFPNHLRATGAGFCFNTGRLLAAPMLWGSGALKAALGLQTAVTILAGFFAAGLFVLACLPETKNTELIE